VWRQWWGEQHHPHPLYTVHLFRELKKRELVVCDDSEGGSSITLTLCTLYTVHLYRELKKRELVVCDDSDGGSSITLTLWGDQAKTFTALHRVLAIRGATVRLYLYPTIHWLGADWLIVKIKIIIIKVRTFTMDVDSFRILHFSNLNRERPVPVFVSFPKPWINSLHVLQFYSSGFNWIWISNPPVL
jgi:hypothetical protein